MNKIIISSSVLGLLPMVALAQGTIEQLINRLSLFANATVPFIIGLAVLVIIWGVFNYVASARDEEKRGEAKQYIIWGIIGVFIMVSVWGLVNILVGSFALTDTSARAGRDRAVVPGGDASGIGGTVSCTKSDGSAGTWNSITNSCN